MKTGVDLSVLRPRVSLYNVVEVRHRRAVILGLVLALTAQIGVTGERSLDLRSDPARCQELKNLKLEGGSVSSAEWHVSLPESNVSHSDAAKESFCRLTAVLQPSGDSEIGVEVWLPGLQRWNGKFKGVGSGGLGGPIFTDALAAGLTKGYATAATDTGHDAKAEPGAFALGHPEKVVDYGSRAIHLTAQTGKAIATGFYKREASRAYFEGCSQGGQEALMEAQRYPQDYDGIIAGDPDYYQTHHEVGAHLWVTSTLYSNARNPISQQQAQLIGDAVNGACDELDGVRDGVLEDPRLCNFDPGTLQCRNGQTEHCLTAAQVVAVRRLWAGPDATVGGDYYPGLERGGEAQLWKGWITPDTVEQNVHAQLGLPFFKYFVFADPGWDFRTFDYKSTPQEIDLRFATTLNAVDPDLTRFQTRGGKLLQYHGFSDPDVPPRASIAYYESVARHARNTHVDPDGFYRLFMVPGMGHCGGGPGANHFEMMTPLEQWVEHGFAPERIVAIKYPKDDPTQPPVRTHPLCPYPKIAKYDGHGDPAIAESFSCSEPAAAVDDLKKPPTDADGTIHVPSFPLPMSSFLSAASRKELLRLPDPHMDLLLAMQECPPAWTAKPAERPHVLECEAEAFYRSPFYQRLRGRYPVKIAPQKIDGVYTEIFTPVSGVNPKNEHRVLIDLHGGGFGFGARTISHMESIPISAIESIKVVSVDYRMSPDYEYPAATDDVIAVYRKLLDTYRSDAIGIYGSSAGALLTTEVVARLEHDRLPLPGAIGLLSGAGSYYGEGDSGPIVSALTGIPLSGITDPQTFPYFHRTPGSDPQAFPIRSNELLAKFPASLLVTGTRDQCLSSAAAMHSRLVANGVPAELHVWDGVGHAFYLDPDLAESREVWSVVSNFFNRYLRVD